MGFGLTISKMIIQQLNGTISVESEVDRGSTFTFDIQVDQEGSSSSEESKLTSSQIGSNIIIRNPINARKYASDDTFLNSIYASH